MKEKQEKLLKSPSDRKPWIDALVASRLANSDELSHELSEFLAYENTFKFTNANDFSTALINTLCDESDVESGIRLCEQLEAQFTAIETKMAEDKSRLKELLTTTETLITIQDQQAFLIDIHDKPSRHFGPNFISFYTNELFAYGRNKFIRATCEVLSGIFSHLEDLTDELESLKNRYPGEGFLIDTHKNALSKILKKLKKEQTERKAKQGAKPLPPIDTIIENRLRRGWEEINDDYFVRENLWLKEKDEEDFIVNFFNGAIPRWGVILTGKIHQRQKARQIIDEIKANINTVEPHIIPLVDAGGEGKSTILMQVMVYFARNKEYGLRVLYRDGLGELSPEYFLKEHNEDSKWLIVVDEAVDSATNLSELWDWLYKKQYRGYQFLIASRDIDVDNLLKDFIRLATQKPLKEFTTGGLNEADAHGIVESWDRFKPRGMGALHGKTIDEAREELLKKAHLGAGFKEGSLYGAIFDVRIEGRLPLHVSELINRLEKEKEQPEKDREVLGIKLLDIYLYIIILHAEGYDLLNEAILAKVLGIESKNQNNFSRHNETLTRDILPLLGREAAIAAHRNYIVSRHRSIALEVKKQLEARDIQFSERITKLVWAARTLFKEAYSYGRHHDLFPKDEIKEWTFGLADHFAKTQPELAIALMETVWEVEKHRDYFILKKLTQILRTYGGPEGKMRALKIFYDGKELEHDRQFYHEWSTCESYANHYYEAIRVAAIAIADDIMGALDNYRIKVSLTILMNAFLKLDDAVYLAAGRACSALSQFLILDSDKDRVLSQVYGKALKDGYIPPASSQAMIVDLLRAIKKANQEGAKSLPRWLKTFDELSFEQLKENFRSYENRRKKLKAD